MAKTVTVQEEKIQKEQGVVILSLKEYHKLLERAVPKYYLTGKAARDLDKLVEESLKEHREGKTISAPSLTEALRRYAKNRKR